MSRLHDVTRGLALALLLAAILVPTAAVLGLVVSWSARRSGFPTGDVWRALVLCPVFLLAALLARVAQGVVEGEIERREKAGG